MNKHYFFFCINIINYIKPEDIINIDYRGLIISTVGGMFGIALIQSIQIPSIYKWGAEKGRIQMFVLVFGMVVIISGIAFLFMKTNVVINTGIIENDQYNQNTIHPLDKIMELNKQATDLFERMLAVEKEKSALLEQLLKEKGK